MSHIGQEYKLELEDSQLTASSTHNLALPKSAIRLCFVDWMYGDCI